jgi:hypothetical protein
MNSILQILKLNELRKGVSSKTGKPYEMQDAECLLLTDTGEVESVGVLQIPRDLMGKVSLGIFLGSFSLRPDMQTRRIGAVLTGLQPYTIKQVKAS